MNTEQAYINGFVKRASEYGFSQDEAIELLKQAAFEGTGFHGSPVYNMIYGDPSKPQTPRSPAMGGAASPVAGGNMGGMSAGIGGGFGQIAHNPAQAAAVPVAQQSNPNRGNELFAGTGFHGSKAYNAIYGDPSKAAPAAQPVASRPSPVAQTAVSAPATPATPNTALLNAKAPANTFGGDVQLGLSGRTSPAPLGPPAPAAAPAAQGGPSNAYLAKVMGSYDPNSRLDRAKADAIRQAYQPGMSANQIYANKGYQAASQRR